MIRHELQEIDQALARIDNRSYRKCAGCGHTISLVRLRLLPTALTCFACKETHTQSA